LLAALAAETSRIRLGTLVTGMTYRQPAMLAVQAVTVDHISSGRLEIGVGAAWFEGEHRAFGFPFPGVRERAHRLEDGITVLRQVMTEENATFHGRHYALEGATYRPRPVQSPHPPIWVGAMGERLMLPVVARLADAWHASAPLDEMVRKSALIDRYAIDAGRDPSQILRAGSIRLDESNDDIRRTAEGFRAAGFSYLVCTWPSAGIPRIEEFAGMVLPGIAAL
jgi:alkanesulfonate monooxygenase SsuD/methylene tetrahydromethanopterin reductase-like flavin-dependent oxidoreductase (luciferase family)